MTSQSFTAPLPWQFSLAPILRGSRAQRALAVSKIPLRRRAVPKAGTAYQHGLAALARHGGKEARRTTTGVRCHGVSLHTLRQKLDRRTVMIDAPISTTADMAIACPAESALASAPMANEPTACDRPMNTSE